MPEAARASRWQDLHRCPAPGRHAADGFEQVLVTPHMGAHADSAINAMGWLSTRDCLAVLAGEPPSHRVL